MVYLERGEKEEEKEVEAVERFHVICNPSKRLGFKEMSAHP